MLYIGLLIYMLEVKFDKKAMLGIVIVTNFCLYINCIIYKERWLGVDTSAYIIQGGQFALG